MPKDELDVLRSYFMKLNSAYNYDGYDSEFAETNDNVNWIVKVDVSLYLPFCTYIVLVHSVTITS